MGRPVDPKQVGRVYVRVALRRTERGMSELFLNGPQVRSGGEHVGGTRMPERVGMHAIDTRRVASIRHDPTSAAARQAPAAVVSEQRGGAIQRLGGQLPQQRVECRCGRWTKRHNTGLTPLPGPYAHEPLVDRDVRPVQCDRFGYPQPRTVQQLQEGTVA